MKCIYTCICVWFIFAWSCNCLFIDLRWTKKESLTQLQKFLSFSLSLLFCFPIPSGFLLLGAFHEVMVTDTILTVPEYVQGIYQPFALGLSL